MINWCNATLDQWNEATLDEWATASLCGTSIYRVEAYQALTTYLIAIPQRAVAAGLSTAEAISTRSPLELSKTLKGIEDIFPESDEI